VGVAVELLILVLQELSVVVEMVVVEMVVNLIVMVVML
jgi:hypothetical protein